MISTASGLAADAADFKSRAETTYLSARERFTTNHADVLIALEFARACFDRAEFAATDPERAGLARNGIAACRQAAVQNPTNAAVQYYLGMNLGQLARTKTLGALPIVGDMEECFKTARTLDNKFDYAGPDRNLGLLYLEAPGWPASVGNKKKAREHLKRCVELAPGYPENQLCLLEAHLKWKEQAEAREIYKTLRELLPQAQSEFSGERWEPSWSDWDRRWKVIQQKLGVTEIGVK